MLSTLALVALAPVQVPTIDLGQSQYGVVLLVTELDRGLAGYGAGVVIDTQGMVLTNLHVLDGARRIHALCYDPDQPSYAAVDGGLDRLLFERQRDLIPVTFVRGEPSLDLAVVRLDKPARVLPMKPAAKPAVVGEPVIALGHPAQNFWTATRGQVSGLHAGFLQHDAAVNKGNSGGPLLNAQLEVLGVNTLVVKEAQGISYARPIALASRLVEIATAPVKLDLSTPEKSALSCARARELGDPAYAQCVHWGSHYEVFRDVVLMMTSGSDPELARKLDREVLKRDGADPRLQGGPKTAARNAIRAWLDKGDGRAEVWAKRYGPFALTNALSDDPAEAGRAADEFLAYVLNATRGGRPPSTPVKPAKTRTMNRAQLIEHTNKEIDEMERDSMGAALLKDLRDWRKETGFKCEVNDIIAIRRAMKMGLRVEKTVSVDDKFAWVVLAGRNLDGSPYRYTVLLFKDGDGWREHAVTEAEARSYGGRLQPPKELPPVINLTAAPLGVAAIVATAPLVLHVHRDSPEGETFDFDFEHTWGVWFDLMRADGSPDVSRAIRLAR